MRAKHGVRRIALLFSCIGAHCACTPEPPKARYTVDEYLADPQLLNQVLAKCANDPGALSRTDPDCINVKAAAERKDIGSLRDLPPLGLVPEEKSGGDESPEPDAAASQPN